MQSLCKKLRVCKNAFDVIKLRHQLDEINSEAYWANNCSEGGALDMKMDTHLKSNETAARKGNSCYSPWSTATVPEVDIWNSSSSTLQTQNQKVLLPMPVRYDNTKASTKAKAPISIATIAESIYQKEILLAQEQTPAHNLAVKESTPRTLLLLAHM